MRMTLAAAVAALAFAAAAPVAQAGDPDFTYLSDDPRAGCGYWETLERCRERRHAGRYYADEYGWRDRDGYYREGRYNEYERYGRSYGRRQYEAGYRAGDASGYGEGYDAGSRGGHWHGAGDGITPPISPRRVEYCESILDDYDPRDGTGYDRRGRLRSC